MATVLDEDNLGPVPSAPTATDFNPGQQALADVSTPMPMPDPGSVALQSVQSPQPAYDPGQAALATIQSPIKSEIEPNMTLPNPATVTPEQAEVERHQNMGVGDTLADIGQKVLGHNVTDALNPNVSLGAAMVKASPVGWVANDVQSMSNTLGNVAGAVGSGLNSLGVNTAPLKTALEKGANLEQTLETATKRGALAYESLYGPALDNIAAIKQAGGTPTWDSVFYNLPLAEKLPEDVRQELAKDLGLVAEPVLDPMWKLHLGGLTEAGEANRLKGLVSPNVGMAGQAGDKALLTFGNKALIQGQPVLDAVGKAQTALRNSALFKGFHTMTEDPNFNMTAEQQKISPMSEASVQTDQIHAYMKDLLNRNSAQLEISPEELSQRMMDWREPAGSQMPFMGHQVEDVDEAGNPITRDATPEETAQQQQARMSILNSQRKATEAGLTPEIIDSLKTQDSANQIYGDIENQNKRDFYLYHQRDPQFQQFLDDNFNPQKQGPGPSGKVGSTFNPSDFEREVATTGMTAREVNNLAQQGKLGTIYPTYKDLFNSYKGPVFSEDMANIEASRYLHNRQVQTTSDLMIEAGKAYGHALNPGALSGEQGAGKNFVYVPHSAYEQYGGGMWFPKPIGDYLNGIDQLPAAAKQTNEFLNQSTKAVKFFNFGLWPKSALKNYSSNLALGFRGGMSDIDSIVDGGKVISRMNKDNPELQFLGLNKLDPLGDDVVLHSPLYGDVTSQQLIDQAHATRGIGMGPARAASIRPLEDEGWLNNPLTRKMYDIHNYAEDASRLPIYMKALKDGATWEGAGKISRDTAFDYGNMGPTDQKLSQYIPFYRFMRNNVPSILGNMVTNPARTFAFEKEREEWNRQHNASNENGMTQFAREGGPLYVGTDSTGQKHYLKTSTFDPTTDINRVVGEPNPGESMLGSLARNGLDYMTSGLTPAISGIYNAIQNHNPTYNQPIDKNLAAGLSTPEMKESIPGLPTTATTDYMLRQFRPFSETAAMFNSNPNHTMGEKMLNLGLGLDIRPNDEERGQINNEYQQKKTFRNQKALLKNYGRQSEQAGEQGDTTRSDIQNTNMQNVGNEMQQEYNPGEDALRQLQNQ